MLHLLKRHAANLTLGGVAIVFCLTGLHCADALVEPEPQSIANRDPELRAPLPDQRIGEGLSKSVEIGGSDSPFVDPDSDALTYSVSSRDPGIVSAAIASDGASVDLVGVKFGAGEVIVTASDGQGGSAADTVQVQVLGADAFPTAKPDFVRMNQNSSQEIEVLSNDTDDNGLSRESLTIKRPPEFGVATVNGTLGTITYEPETGFSGNDTLIYTIEDIDALLSNDGFVYITVEGAGPQPPIARDDSVTTSRDNAVVVSVLENDTDDVALDEATVEIKADVSNGTTTVNTTGSVQYEPNNGYVGSDSFTYTVRDDAGLESNEATVSITVNDAANQAPVANDDNVETQRDVKVSIDVLANDTDDRGINASSVDVTQPPANGSVSIQNSGIVEYTPNSGFTGSDSFEYRVSDGNGVQSNTATVTIEVKEPTAAASGTNDNYTIDEDGDLSKGSGDGVLANDSGTGTLTATLVEGVAHGTLNLSDNGSFSYEPAQDYNGSDGFTYTLTDGNSTTDGPISVNITVRAVNDRPTFTLSSNTIDVEAGEERQVVSNFAQNIRTGPSDESGQSLNFQVSVDDASAFLEAPTINSSNGELRYKPIADVSSSRRVNIQVTLKDNGGTQFGGQDTSQNSAFRINVNEPAFPLPNPNSDDYSVNEDGDLGVNESSGVLSNDAGGKPPVTAELVSGPEHGDVSLSSNGAFSYDPDRNYFGNDSFTYRMKDAAGRVSGNSEVRINVRSVNDAPFFNLGSDITVDDGDSYTGDNFATNINAGPPNESGQSLTFQISVTDGSVFDQAPKIDVNTGRLTFKAVETVNSQRVVTVTVKLKDNGGTSNGGLDLSSTKSFKITITP